MASNRGFRFKDLPPEVRDEIYRIILCTWPGPKSTWDEERKLAVVPNTVAMIERKPDTSILLADHQIGRESKDVMLKGNLFIRVITRGIPMDKVLIPKQVPIVSMNSKRIKAFKGFVMTHEITMQGGIPVSFELMILRRDLDLFCQALAAADTIIPSFAGSSKHCVTINNPFKNTSTPKYLDIKNQERLLEPYRKHLHGFLSFKVKGNVTPRLAQDISTEVKKEPIPDPEELLNEILHQKDLGGQYFRNKNGTMASETWSKALIKLLRLSMSNVWPRMKAEAGADFANRITELFFLLNCNLAANTLEAMREADSRGDSDLAGQYADSLYTAVQKATEAPQALGTDWRPSPQQEAKLCYRLAMAHRLARDNLQVAEQVINLAATAVPGDVAIQREKEEIARWRARGG